MQVYSGTIVQGDANAVGHVICATAGTGAAKQSVNYVTERVVGNGSFGVVFQATCQETGEVVSTCEAHGGLGKTSLCQHPGSQQWGVLGDSGPLCVCTGAWKQLLKSCCLCGLSQAQRACVGL